jgi:ubiquinone/menaquinone biosynthesis C-methylase UbiE
MASRDAAFVGSIPEKYDRYLGPMLFERFADDLAARLTVVPEVRVLETACGTGILTERLARRLEGYGTLVATDLNPPMLAYAQRKLAGVSHLTWRQADATQLPFEEASFDAVVCQFGLMFFPDKDVGIREAFRVLRPGGWFLFNVPEALEHNPVPHITHETVTSFFPSDPPQFLRVPYSLHDRGAVCASLDAAGFKEVTAQPLVTEGSSPSAEEAAIGLVEGSPLYAAIVDRQPDSVADIRTALVTNLVARLGDRPLRCPMRATVFSARKP